MTREKFPEKIPFRLTRMLTNAMEVRWSFVCEYSWSVKALKAFSSCLYYSYFSYLGIFIKHPY